MRGDPGQGSFSAFCYKSGQLVGIEFDQPRRRITCSDAGCSRQNGSIAPEQAADISFDLKAALA